MGPHTGFIKEVSAPGGSNQVVYDDEMRRIGYYTPMGATYRTPPGKESELLGTYDAASSLRALYGIQDLSVPVQHLPMPPRMTLEDLDKQAEESP
ncbi:MAG: hypothetical protein O7H41_03295 [Planctomycetota bacterium]|nr:hypothetical protein [Planctomycetota bacterium]